MGINTYVIGFALSDEKYQKMKQIWENCIEMNISIPDEVDDFFNYEEPNEDGIEIEIPNQEWSDGDMSTGIEVNIKNILEIIEKIRFVNSW